MSSLGINQQFSPSFYDGDDIIFQHDSRYWIKYYFDSFFTSDFLRGLSQVYTLPTNLEGIAQPKTDYRIKQGKAILLPAGKLVAYCKMEAFEEKKQEMKDTVIKGMDAFSDFNVFLDGELVSNECFRQQSDYFKIRGDKNTPDRMAIVDGLWLFIKPNTLEKGNHTISTYIACSMERTRISLNYNLGIS
jgi:hypothetical protein